MSTNDQVDRICRNVTAIMVKYPELFPIIDMIKKTNEDHGYIRHAVEFYCGLRTIARVKNDALMELWVSIPTNMYEMMEKTLIRDILFEYIGGVNTPKDRTAIDTMFKKENLL